MKKQNRPTETNQPGPDFIQWPALIEWPELVFSFDLSPLEWPALENRTKSDTIKKGKRVRK